MSLVCMCLSGLNFISAAAFSIKFLFVAPNNAGIYYGIVSWICAFGFIILSKFLDKGRNHG